MKNGYSEFVRDLREKLLEATNYDGDMICFKEADEHPKTIGDRLLLKRKQREGVYEVCALYVEDLYDEFQKNLNMNIIIDEIVRRLDSIAKSECFEKSKNLDNYDLVKNDLFIRLLNVSRNMDDLKDAIYYTIGDIALVLYAKLGEMEGCFTSLKIKKYILNKWNRDEKMVFNDALLNTYFLTPPRIYHWERLLYDDTYEGENFMNLMFEESLKSNVFGICLSTTNRTNGAVAIFLPGVAQRLGELLESSFYMVFTSVHEVMIHKDDMVEPDQLKTILDETVQETTPEEDFLTGMIYHYERDTGLFDFT